MKTRIRFQLQLSHEEFLHYYRGQANAILVRAEDGRRLQIPANRFRPFITHDGLHGRFEIELDEHNKLLGICRIDQTTG